MSLDDLKELPADVQRQAGFALHPAKLGLRPIIARNMTGLPGVQELRINFDTDTYRVVYIVNLGNTLYVLHSFQKKSTSGISTPKKELEKIKARLNTAKEVAR